MTDAVTCILCPPGRDRIPDYPPVCGACRAWLASMLTDLRELALELAADPDPVPDTRTPRHDHDRWRDLDHNLIGHDPIAADLPSGATRHPADVPINIDGVDISLPARQAARALFVRGDQGLGTDPDQIGHLPLATTLDTWVRDWREQGAPGDVLPTARVAPMLDWLAMRVDWACDRHPAVDEFADMVREYRSAIRGILGLVDVPRVHQGIPCPECGTQPLFRRHGGPRDGNLWIECQGCPHILKPEEFEEYCSVLRDGLTVGVARVAVTVVAWARARRVLAERRAGVITH